jgi:hypothetical protein
MGGEHLAVAEMSCLSARVLLQSGVVAMFKPLIDSCPDSIPVDYDENEAAYRTVVDVAKCDVTQRIVSVFCELAHTRNFRPISAIYCFHEFSFHIYVRSIDGSELSIFTQNRQIARNYIPNIVIPLIMKIVIGSCNALITEAQPEAIYRVTKTIFPNEKSMFKHDLVTNCLYALGYSLLETGADQFGRTYWAMARE